MNYFDPEPKPKLSWKGKIQRVQKHESEMMKIGDTTITCIHFFTPVQPTQDEFSAVREEMERHRLVWAGEPIWSPTPFDCEQAARGRGDQEITFHYYVPVKRHPA